MREADAAEEADLAAAEAAVAATAAAAAEGKAGAGGGDDMATALLQPGLDKPEAAAGAPGSKLAAGGSSQASAAGDELADCAVLPWWLPPERIPRDVSGALRAGTAGRYWLRTAAVAAAASSAATAAHCRPTLLLPLCAPAAEWGTTGVLAGKSAAVLRDRVLGTTPAGRAVWAHASQYAVLFSVAGPPATWCAPPVATATTARGA